MLKSITLLLVLVVAYTSAEQARFDGFRLLRLHLENQKQIDLMQKLEGNLDLDIWHMTHLLADVSVSPAAFHKYRLLFTANGIKFDVIQENLQDLFDEEARSMAKAKLESKDIVNTFASYTDTLAWMALKAQQNPLLVKTRSIGKTYENRDLQVIVIGAPSAQKNIWIDCGIHAREWISPATCIYFIDWLITEWNKPPVPENDARKLLSHYSFEILPIHNPDGYAYSQASFRMQRKNRQPNAGTTCIGTDLNRNFDYFWMYAGASNNPCADTFAGPVAGSELETKAVKAAILAKEGLWDAFITIHTYGQWLFTPWGYSPNVLPPDYSDLNEKLRLMAAAIRVPHNSVFTHGSSSQILYAAAGGSDDWAYGVANIKYSHCLELRPGQSGTDSQYGFALPADRIPAAGRETTLGLVNLFLNIMNDF